MKSFLAIALLLIFVTSVNPLKGGLCYVFLQAFRVMAPGTVEVAHHLDATVREDADEYCGDSCCVCPCKVGLCGCGIIPAILCVSCGYEAAKGCRCCVMEQPK